MSIFHKNLPLPRLYALSTKGYTSSSIYILFPKIYRFAIFESLSKITSPFTFMCWPQKFIPPSYLYMFCQQITSSLSLCVVLKKLAFSASLCVVHKCIPLPHFYTMFSKIYLIHIIMCCL